MHNACCIPKATDTHSENVILFAFSLQQWLHERARLIVIRSVKWLQLVDQKWESRTADIHSHPNELLASSLTPRLCFAIIHTCDVNKKDT